MAIDWLSAASWFIGNQRLHVNQLVCRRLISPWPLVPIGTASGALPFYLCRQSLTEPAAISICLINIYINDWVILFRFIAKRRLVGWFTTNSIAIPHTKTVLRIGHFI